jgi:hypothetical protein
MFMRMSAKTYLLGAVILSVCGCGGKFEDGIFGVKSFFGGFSSPPPKELARNAFDPTVHPDTRREAVIKLSSYEWGLTETYLNGYDVILRAEMRKPRGQRDLGLMSATIGALGKGQNPKYIPILVLALKLSISPQVRWDAALALDKVIGDKAIAQLCRSSDPDVEASVDVRAACCRAMRHYRRQDVIDTLVGRLASDEPFAVRYRARETLAGLCRRDFGPDYADWVGTKLEALPSVETKKEEKKRSMWNPLNWFR